MRATIKRMLTARSSTLGVRGSGGSGDLRQGNLTSILRYVRDRGPSSRHDIAEGCGLGISTMTDLIGELRSRRLVKELDPIRRPAAGRPTRPIALDGEPWCALGIQIDVESVQFSASTVGGSAFWQESVPLELREVGSDGYQLIKAVLAEQLTKLPSDRELLTCEVAVPGFVARDRGTVRWSKELAWQDFPLGQLVREAMRDLGLADVAVGVANECQLAALFAGRVELRLPTESVALYLGGGRRLGGGLIIGGEIFGGANAGAGDVAHLRVDPGHVRCWCGREGCLDTVLGLAYLLANSGLLDLQAAGALVEEDPRLALQRLTDAAGGGDERTLATLNRAANSLGHVLDDLIGLLNPHAVILGDHLGALSPYLMSGIDARLELRTATAPFSHTAVVAVDAHTPRVVRGAALAAQDACLNDPLGLTHPIN
jgi:predicted NBD/HSP70 family sugar kinase